MAIIETHIVVCDRAVPGFEPGDIRTACRNGMENPSAPTWGQVIRRALSAGWRVDGHPGFPRYAVCPCCQWRYLPGEVRP